VLNSAHFAAVRALSERQIAALPSLPVHAGPDEGEEESAAALDLAATRARIDRHAAEAVRANPSPEARYEDYVAACVDALRLPNISGAEVCAVHKRVTRSGRKNSLPPPSLLVRLLLCLIHDQRARSMAGVPLRFNSLYRSPSYNAAIGGASRSQHRVGTARDRVLIGASVSDLHRIDRALRGTRHVLTAAQRAVVERVRRDYQLGPVFTGSVYGEPFSARGVSFDGRAYTHSGGLGRYSSFVHADCRGAATDWRG
jgi:hypothetical protein